MKKQFFQSYVFIVLVIMAAAAFLYYVPITQSLFSLKIKPAPTAIPDYSGWRSYTNQKFSIYLKYPDTFQLKPGQTGPLAEWQLYGLTDGNEIVSIEIPRSYQSRTNFGGASLRIGVSTEATAVKACLNPPSSFGYKDAYVQRMIGGAVFREFTRSESGAGNHYSFSSYRAVRNGGCEVFEYVIHHSNLQNYPLESKVREYDKIVVTKALESILDTVGFTK